MDKEQFSREVDYGMAMVIINEMLAAGLISNQEYKQIDKMYSDRYRPIFQFPTSANEPGSRQETNNYP